MCASCGCERPEDTMGDDRNILWSDIEAAAEAMDLTPGQVVENIKNMAEQKGALST